MTTSKDLTSIILHGFFRSTASWRVRIALNLKGLTYEQKTYHLRSREQLAEAYIAVNPQGLVPTLEIDGKILTQSLAICEYLDETIPMPPLLPNSLLEKAHVRAFAQVIACDIHPVQNLKILRRLSELGLNQDAVNDWAKVVIEEGLTACEALLQAAGNTGDFCFGSSPTLADICLIPQMANARRFGVDINFPALERIEKNCLSIASFEQALPANQQDAE